MTGNNTTPKTTTNAYTLMILIVISIPTTVNYHDSIDNVDTSNNNDNDNGGADHLRPPERLRALRGG